MATTSRLTKETFLNEMGEFTWDFGHLFVIQTRFGMFVWSDPGYGGDNTVRPYEGRFKDFFYPYGRDKGIHNIGTYCGKDIILLEKPFGRD